MSKKKNQTSARGGTERELQNLFRVAVTSEIPDARFFVRSIGVFELSDGRIFRAGIKGQCDLYATVRGGLHLEIECKALNGRMSPEQVAWRDFCRAWGIPWILLIPQRNESQEEIVARWVNEVRALIQSHTNASKEPHAIVG